MPESKQAVPNTTSASRCSSVSRHVSTALLALCFTLAGCSPTVRVEAPDKPIEINLNVKIEHEIRVKVDQELDQLFEENSELF